MSDDCTPHCEAVTHDAKRQCKRCARQWFVWWPNDPALCISSFLCKEHALRSAADANKARVPYRRVNPIPFEELALRGSASARTPEPTR
jgi:hypothetical protein